MGFSVAGLAVSLAVLAPSLLLLRFRPRSPLPAAQVPQLLGWLERTGQALCLVIPAITAPGNLEGWWVALVLVGLASYYALWGRYLGTGRPGTALYRSWFGVPVPMAVLPVVVFLAAAGWLSNPWIAAGAVILGLGHIPASLVIARRAAV